MSDGFFVVNFLPDPENHNDFAIKWQGRSGTRDRAGAFALSAAKFAWYTYASAIGKPHSPLPKFISAKHRIIRASDGYCDSGLTINIKHLRRNPSEHPERVELTNDSMINYLDFLISKIDHNFHEDESRKIDTEWRYGLDTESISTKLKREIIQIYSFIDTYSYIRTTYSHSTFLNAVNSLVLTDFLSSHSTEIKCSRSYMFEFTPPSATLRAARFKHHKEVGARLARHFRLQGNKDLAKRMEAWAARPAPKNL